MANFVTDEFKKLQKEHAETLSDYQMDSRYGGSYISKTFRELCDINDKLIVSKLRHEPWEQALDNHAEYNKSNDVKVNLFMKQAAISLTKQVYPENAEEISQTANLYTRWNIADAVKTAGLKGLIAVTDIEDNFGQIVDCFQDERLPEESVLKFSGVVGAVQDTFDSLQPFVEGVEQTREQIGEMDSAIRMHERSIKHLEGRMQDSLTDYAKNLYTEAQELEQ